MLHKAGSFKIRRSWDNSAMLRTKLLNEKSSNIYKITEHFHPGSVSVPRGKSLQWQSTGWAPYQVLYCTGTLQHSPLHGRRSLPHVAGEDRGPWKLILLGAILLLRLPHGPSGRIPYRVPVPWVHTTQGAFLAVPNSLVCRQGESASLPFWSLLWFCVSPFWTCLIFSHHSSPSLALHKQRKEGCGVCKSALHPPSFPAPRWEPVAASSPWAPALCTSVSVCTEEQRRWQNLILLRQSRCKTHCARTVRCRDVWFFSVYKDGTQTCILPVPMRGTEGRQLPVQSPGQWGARPHCCPVCSSGDRTSPGAGEGTMTDRKQTRASETPWRCTSVRWDDSSSYSHDVCAATVQQPATPTSYTHFVLQTISSLRKVPIRKLTNRLAIPDVKMFAWAAYTGGFCSFFFF